MNRTTQFRELLKSPHLEFLMEAHSGLSAKLVQQAGFRGVWASGLAMSAAMGVRDHNEASWTQVMDVLEFMSDAVQIPILVDADTGYGNFNNVRRLVRKLEQRGLAAMCIEDKLFPKTNSFIAGETQELADVDEFVGKIKAAKDTQQDPDFCVVARVEALIAGRGMVEAIDRASRYAEAGADAVLMHSKKTSADEILAFMQRWHGACPVVVVPTMYPQTSARVLEEAGVKMVIWANHLLRASMTAMKEAAATIHRELSVLSLEPQIASVADVFQIQDEPELQAAEKRYLPTKRAVRQAVTDK